MLKTENPKNGDKAAWLDPTTLEWRTDCPVDYLTPGAMVRTGWTVLTVVSHYNEPAHPASPRVNFINRYGRTVWLTYRAIQTLHERCDLELIEKHDLAEFDE